MTLTNSANPETPSPIRRIKYPIINVIAGLVILLLVSGLLIIVFHQNSIIKVQTEMINSLVRQKQPTPPETAKTDAVTFPQFPFITQEGTVRIQDQHTYNFSQNKNFILVLTLTAENALNQEKTQWLPTKEYRYPIRLDSGFDSVYNPLIARQHKYGCVTLQASGYVGAYVFDIQTGKGLYRGPQYSNCIDWIDPDRVLITENLYDTLTVTDYIFDASTGKKTQLSQFLIQRNQTP